MTYLPATGMHSISGQFTGMKRTHRTFLNIIILPPRSITNRKKRITRVRIADLGERPNDAAHHSAYA